MAKTAKTSFMKAVTDVLRAPFSWELDKDKSDNDHHTRYYTNSVTGDRKIVQLSVIGGVLYDLHRPFDMKWLAQSKRNGIVESYRGRKVFTQDELAEHKNSPAALPLPKGVRSAVIKPTVNKL
jgi:hypothetical protein